MNRCRVHVCLFHGASGQVCIKKVSIKLLPAKHRSHSCTSWLISAASFMLHHHWLFNKLFGYFGGWLTSNHIYTCTHCGHYNIVLVTINLLILIPTLFAAADLSTNPTLFWHILLTLRISILNKIVLAAQIF